MSRLRRKSLRRDVYLRSNLDLVDRLAWNSLEFWIRLSIKTPGTLVDVHPQKAPEVCHQYQYKIHNKSR
jgi:hypothetical protein